MYLSLVIFNEEKWIVQVILSYLGASKNNNIEEQGKIGESFIFILFFAHYQFSPSVRAKNLRPSCIFSRLLFLQIITF